MRYALPSYASPLPGEGATVAGSSGSIRTVIDGWPGSAGNAPFGMTITACSSPVGIDAGADPWALNVTTPDPGAGRSLLAASAGGGCTQWYGAGGVYPS